MTERFNKKKGKKMKLKLTGAFSMEFGTNGFVRGFNNKWVQLIVTNDGVYKDGILVAKGKLRIVYEKP